MDRAASLLMSSAGQPSPVESFAQVSSRPTPRSLVANSRFHPGLATDQPGSLDRRARQHLARGRPRLLASSRSDRALHRPFRKLARSPTTRIRIRVLGRWRIWGGPAGLHVVLRHPRQRGLDRRVRNGNVGLWGRVGLAGTDGSNLVILFQGHGAFSRSFRGAMADYRPAWTGCSRPGEALSAFAASRHFPKTDLTCGPDPLSPGPGQRRSLANGGCSGRGAPIGARTKIATTAIPVPIVLNASRDRKSVV